MCKNFFIDYFLFIVAGTTAFTAREEQTNYALLCQLLVTMGSRALRETFNSIIPPQNLQEHLKGYQVHAKLESLRKKRILNSKQWAQLYPAMPSFVSSGDFDSTLLLVLLRTVCELRTPAAGWDAPPHAADISREADIARVKYFVSTVFGHADSASVSGVVFTKYWDNLREVLVRLGGTGCEGAISKMKNQKLDPFTEEHYKELLKQWKKNDDNLKNKMNELQSEIGASDVEGEL